MTALLLARVRVNGPEGYRSYIARSTAAVLAHCGRFMFRGTEPELLEGTGNGQCTVIILV